MTMVAVLVFVVHNYWGYHFHPEEVELGTFHSISSPLGISGPRYNCDFRIFLASHYPDSFEQRVQRHQQELHGLVFEVIRAASHQDLKSPALANLRTAIKDAINKQLGRSSSTGLVEDVVISEYSYQLRSESASK